MQVLAHNLAAQFTNRQLNITTDQKGKSAEKLSSGYRINRSADDAAGLSISEEMRRQIRGLNKGGTNIQEGISLCQIADGALGKVTSILQRMRQLSIQAYNFWRSNIIIKDLQNVCIRVILHGEFSVLENIRKGIQK